MANQSKDGKFQRALKWMGYAAAILSFLGTLYGLGKYVYDRAETNRKIEALLSAEAVQLQGRDYKSAWRTLEQASQLKPDASKVRAAQEALALAWLEDLPWQLGERFSDFAPKLDAVLTRAVASAKPGTARADLLAHLGWVYFVRLWERTATVDPTTAFAKAVAEDPNNPYANAMWGFFIIWRRDKLSGAEEHFALALASNRAGDFIRNLQSHALGDCHSDECGEELIRVASAMRKEQRMPDSTTVSHIFSMYYFSFLHPSAETVRFINLVPPAEHVATFHWLFDKVDFDKSNSRLRAYYLAVLQEAAGQREEALANYRLAIADDQPNTNSFWDPARAAIKRLSR